MGLINNNRVPSFGPRCPNHGVALDGCGFPLPKKGTGMCPVSGASFDFEVEVDEEHMVKGKNGEMEPSVGWNLNGDEPT